MTGRVIALSAFAAAAIVAPLAQTQVVLAPSLFHTAELRSNTITAFTVTCPPGSLAVSAGIFTPAPGATLLSL